MGKFHQFLKELPAHHMLVFWFLDDNLSKYQWIFTKFGMRIDIVKSGLGLLMGKFCQLLTELSAQHTLVVGYYHFRFLITTI